MGRPHANTAGQAGTRPAPPGGSLREGQLIFTSFHYWLVAPVVGHWMMGVPSAVEFASTATS
ncbi:hypothetical protein ACIPSH_27135 [Streptomyces iakyrus]|uniref:hypothetical protein n=1 Tax=Streptomyces iakyrus TaxID=68219 RepID=UPI00382CCA01